MICTPMYSSGVFPISSDTITGNKHDEEPITCTKFINSIRPGSERGMAWVRWYKVMRCNSESETFYWLSVDGPHHFTFDPILSMKP